MPLRYKIPLLALLAASFILWIPAGLEADQVIMKDGTVYKGKIQIDTDKAVLIGNPPFDPNSYLLEADDIEKIIYEEYHPNPPSERKRGLTFEGRLGNHLFSKSELSIRTAPSVYIGMGFRVHPLIELNGGLDWMPFAHARDQFSVSNGTTTRHYDDFWQYGAVFSVRVYPFYTKPWKTEPYLATGYRWSNMIPKGSGDSLKGAGWHIAGGLIRPVTRHIFVEARLAYENIQYDTIHFLGQESGISPDVKLRSVAAFAGVSYRM